MVDSDHDPASLDKVTELDHDPESLDEVAEVLQTTEKHGPDKGHDFVQHRDKASELRQREVRLSVVSRKYDLDNTGVLDEHEKELRAMDQGDGLEPQAVYRKLLELSTVANKLSSTKRLLLTLFIFGIFIVCSNLAMASVAVNLSKEVQVNESGTLIAAAGGGIIATKAVGTSYRTTQETMNASLSVPTEARRLNLNSEGDICNHVDFDPVFENAMYLKGTLSKEQCSNAHQDAMNGASVSLTMTNEETHRLSEATTLYETALVGCQFVKIIVAQDKTWYFRSCDENAEKCEWFETTEKDDFDVPCCLKTFEELSGLGSQCVCSKQCESNYECVPAGDGSSTCVDQDDGSNEPAFKLHQDYFNHVGRLEGVSEELFDTVFKAMGLVLAMQDHVVYDGITYEMKRKETQANADVRLNATDGNDSFGGGNGMYALDEVAVEKVDDICYGVWRGTAPRFEDWGQNFNLRREHILQGCNTRQGFANAFFKRDIWFNQVSSAGEVEKKAEQKLRDCASECVPSHGQKCTVVLAGHSQGGALAMIGAALLHDLHPVVITSASPPAFYPVDGKLCPAINQDRVFRFIGTRTDFFGKLKYDMVPFLTASATQVGHEFRVTEKSTGSVAYYYRRNPKVYLNRYSWIIVHHFKNYIIPQLYTPINVAREFPLRLGFDNDLSCSRNDECGSGRCDRVGIKYSLANFGNENGVLLHNRVCKARGDDGAWCLENADCGSGRCEFTTFYGGRKCMSKVDDGGGCNEGSDCASGRCEFVTVYGKRKCLSRANSGVLCNEDSDCQTWKCTRKSWRNRRRCE